MALRAGDVVFTEASHSSVGRVLIRAVSGLSRTVHVAIASGNGDTVYESVPGGVRAARLSYQDDYTVFRNKLVNIQALIATIAEGFVANVAHEGGGYGGYAHGSAAVTGLSRGGRRGGEQSQWGNPGSSSSFYCSNFVARVLLAAKQSGGTHVFEGTLDYHILPVTLKDKLAGDTWWWKVP